jgi:hypothetical protein
MIMSFTYWLNTESVKGLDFVLAKHKPLNPLGAPWIHKKNSEIQQK